jgi:hypothetical protein
MMHQSTSPFFPSIKPSKVTAKSKIILLSLTLLDIILPPYNHLGIISPAKFFIFSLFTAFISE